MSCPVRAPAGRWRSVFLRSRRHPAFCVSRVKLIKYAFLPGRANREARNEARCQPIRTSAGNAGGPSMCFTRCRPTRGFGALRAGEPANGGSGSDPGLSSKARGFTKPIIGKATARPLKMPPRAAKPSPSRSRRPSPSRSRRPSLSRRRKPRAIRKAARPSRSLQSRQRNDGAFAQVRAVASRSIPPTVSRAISPVCIDLRLSIKDKSDRSGLFA